MIRSITNRKRKSEESSKKVSFTAPSSSGHFASVLTKPFRRWNAIESVLIDFIPEWSNHQRSYIILNLIRFLELKVIMGECSPTGSLLAPTSLVDRAWKALVLETRLYPKVIRVIQTFHQQPKRMVHYSVKQPLDNSGFQERIHRTQALFKCYYDEMMPVNLEDIDHDGSLGDTSALTDNNGAWGITNAPCSSRLKPSRVKQNRDLGKDVKASSKTPSYWNLFSIYFCYEVFKEAFGDDDTTDTDTVIFEDDISSEETAGCKMPMRCQGLRCSETATIAE